MIETVISSSVLILIVIFLRTVFKRRIKSGFRYAMWLIVAVRLALPFGLAESPFSIMNIVEDLSAEDTEISEDTEIPGIAEDLTVPADTPAETGAGSFTSAENAPAAEQKNLRENANSETENNIPEKKDSPPPTIGKKPFSIKKAAFILWITVAFALIMWYIAANVIFYLRLRRTRKPTGSDSPLKIFTTSEILSPCIFGTIRPSIYIPENSCADEDNMRFVIAHELCHYYHGDTIWAAVRCILSAIYWFDPFAWAAAVLSKRDCESACDESAIKMVGEEMRLEYGKAVMKFVPRKNSGVFGVASTSMSSAGNVLKERITLIAKKPKNTSSALTFSAFAVTAAALVTFTSALSEIPLPIVNASVPNIEVPQTGTVSGGKRKISPLVYAGSDAYIEKDGLSVTVTIDDLRSSLYYPDIVAVNADPKLFVISALVKVKNISHEDKSFNFNDVSLICGENSRSPFAYNDGTEDIPSGKIAAKTMLFPCSLDNAESMNGIVTALGELTLNGDLVSDDITEEIAVQRNEDIAEKLYRRFYIHRAKGYYSTNSVPTTYECHHIRSIESGGHRYLSVSFTAANRSDYAQLIEPGAFAVVCSGEDGSENVFYPSYISANEDLMHDPLIPFVKIDGIKNIFDVPGFLCMSPEGNTDFTLIYEIDGYTTLRYMNFNGTHPDEPYYSKAKTDGAVPRILDIDLTA